jgi:hypothetical protein
MQNCIAMMAEEANDVKALRRAGSRKYPSTAANDFRIMENPLSIECAQVSTPGHQ